MSYVDAGYALGLSALFLYALSLCVRRRRLERRVGLDDPSRPGGEGEKVAGGP
ncbi:MAG TPA: hypothetical protein VMB82_13020 [Acidimicrobiales bacterium]|nr:hypothetical protein [Acidimicrobiales bacterium]